MCLHIDHQMYMFAPRFMYLHVCVCAIPAASDVPCAPRISESKAVELGQSVELTCSLPSSCGGSCKDIQWRRSGKSHVLTGRHRRQLSCENTVEGGVTSILRIPKAYLSDRGGYECRFQYSEVEYVNSFTAVEVYSKYHTICLFIVELHASQSVV